MWTEQQLAAINTRGRNILVAAGAGTGKTAVLVERIIQGLLAEENPLDLGRLLVVTFTDAAAAEMRDRIRKALGEAPGPKPLQPAAAAAAHHAAESVHLHPPLLLLRGHPPLLPSSDLDPSFRVMDENEAMLLQHEALDGLFEELYAGEGPFLSLVEAYGGRTDEKLRELVLAMSDYSRSLPRPEEWLSRAAAQFQLPPDAKLEELPWYPLIEAACSQKLSRARELLLHGLALAHSPEGPHHRGLSGRGARPG
jgi:ATP-dependent helicase/nuclease subunit A